MERFIQHEPLFIRHFTTSIWPYPVHNHNHFELMFIHRGSGYHELNGAMSPYRGKCMFLLAPADYHTLIIQEETQFSVLKFSNVYLDGAASESAKNEWNKLIDHLLVVSNAYDSCLVKSAGELDKIDHIMRMIVREWQERNTSNEVIFYLIRSVFALIKRNAFHQTIPGHLPDGNLFIGIMNHIHIHIHHPESLSLSTLSKQFNLSPNHLSTLFKRQMGISVKKYISDYKFKLIENRLKFGNSMIKEISNEFGFTDLSHFNKFLKNQGGINPKDIRKKSKAEPEY
ncbi:AraC-like DNA-binding protein [Pedobacter cryoconitis]|uniref:AraC-like DNA-binding protein n=1 Tax=Pedobacter cryoconitis TaxID=188932 RepID=A0A7W8YXL2_9SPHI|nr:AraC family transcriptional regulator [Pedobacter cryoconitis]MBB5623651.1 AraC-like DNA-binding protein [Pedobacter cryoconitis]MBB5646166.1 AraC-like DNA-binding protein [Pedobacter cryoconitis]